MKKCALYFECLRRKIFVVSLLGVEYDKDNPEMRSCERPHARELITAGGVDGGGGGDFSSGVGSPGCHTLPKAFTM